MPSRITDRDLERVFGPGAGSTPWEWAAASTRLFVRGLDQLAFDDSPRAQGRRLTAREALDAYGFDTLLEVADEGSAVISSSTGAAGRVLRDRRDALRLPIRSVASAAGYTEDIVRALEESKRRPVREYEQVARVLGLDERMLSYRSEPVGNESVAVRMRTLHDERPALTNSVVASLAEAAWVAMTQVRLEGLLQCPLPDATFSQDSFFGNSAFPAYRVGYQLADRVREQLGLGTAPIESMRDLLERRLRIPVIQAELGSQVAGATVASGERRAIVVNLSGLNAHVFVRRSTLAHELCHILFDPPGRLQDLRVDEYADLDRHFEDAPDFVEQRANAFAVQLLAPSTVVRHRYDTQGAASLAGLLQEYGISRTAGRYQMWNAIGRSEPLHRLEPGNVRPAVHWEGNEAYTAAYHPIPGLTRHPSRTGRFCALALRASQEGLISWDTAATWLHCSESQAMEAVDSVRELFPDVFA